MDFLATIETVRAAKDLAEALATPIRSEPNDREKRTIKQLINALRALYFMPDGTRGLLVQISSGGYPTREEIEIVLPDWSWID